MQMMSIRIWRQDKMATEHPHKEPESRMLKSICPECGERDETYVYDAHARIHKCRECVSKWGFRYAKEQISDEEYLNYIGVDQGSEDDQDDRALTSRQEEILEMKQSLGELKSIRDPSPDTARRIRREQEKLDDLMARERIDEVREKLRSLRKILIDIERDNEIDRARLNDDLGNEWEQHKKTTEEIRESIDERRDLLHQVEMYMNDLKED